MSTDTDVQWQMLQTLNDISGKLDNLITLIQLGQKKELTMLKDQVLGRSEVRRKIYNLCTGELTLNEIAKKLNQKLPNISKEISFLEESSLIIIKKSGSTKFPQKTVI